MVSNITAKFQRLIIPTTVTFQSEHQKTLVFNQILEESFIKHELFRD